MDGRQLTKVYPSPPSPSSPPKPPMQRMLTKKMTRTSMKAGADAKSKIATLERVASRRDVTDGPRMSLGAIAAADLANC